MYLKSLTISDKESVIREVRFHAGLNLIVDETPGKDVKETGNNVGKTTVLMLVDYCFDADPKVIFTDPESKRDVYTLIKDFLVTSEVLVTLILKEDLHDEESKEVQIERNFISRKGAMNRINGRNYTKKNFARALTEHLFPDQVDGKPTLRQIISHNIRYKDLAVNNTLRTLDRFTKDTEYETLHLFMLGCDSAAGETKQQLIDRIRMETTFKRRLEKSQTKSAYEALLTILDREIDALNDKGAALLEQAEYDQDEGDRTTQLLDDSEVGFLALWPCFLGLGDLGTFVVGRMIALVLLCFVEFPVLIEVAARSQGSKP